MSDSFNHILQQGGPLFNNQQFLHLEQLAQLKERELFDADAIVIETTNEKTVIAMLHRIRSMRFKNFYLKPVYLGQANFPEEIIRQTDGVMDIALIEQVIAQAAIIGSRIQEVQTINSRYSFKEAALVKTLQFLFTRDTDLVPFRSRSAPIGYIFPFLSNIIPTDENPVLLDVLKKGEEEGWLDPQILDKVNLCKSCYGGYLNFRESCTNCSSIDLKSIELIHHFRCAYIGPGKDFEKGDKLICPKCDKELRHIGIDYDKPSEVNQCNDCGHQSQEVHMKALCVDCGTDNELQYLQTRAISRYHMTAFGRDLAISGFKKFDPQEVPTNEDTRVVPYNVWTILYRLELQRTQLQKVKSKSGRVLLNEQALSHLDLTTREKIMRECLLTISHYLRPIDTVTTKDLRTFLMILPEIKDKELNSLEEILDYNLQKLLGDNLGIENIIQKIEFFDILPSMGLDQL